MAGILDLIKGLYKGLGEGLFSVPGQVRSSYFEVCVNARACVCAGVYERSLASMCSDYVDMR